MPRPSNTQERRGQIARALMKVMVKKGYDGASMHDVAIEAGLTQGLIHYHFKSKEEILLSVLAEIITTHDERLNHRMAEIDEPATQLETYINFHLALGFDADPETLVCWIVLTGEALRRESLTDAYNKAMTETNEYLANIIANGVDRGVFNCSDIDIAASAINAAIQGYYVLATTTPGLIPTGSAAESVIKMAKGLLNQGK